MTVKVLELAHCSRNAYNLAERKRHKLNDEGKVFSMHLQLCLLILPASIWSNEDGGELDVRVLLNR